MPKRRIGSMQREPVLVEPLQLAIAQPSIILPSLAKVLQLPAFRGAELVCGHAQTEQPVTWVHVAEVMDVWRFLSSGELLLSTGLELARVTPATRRQSIYYRLDQLRDCWGHLKTLRVSWVFSSPLRCFVQVTCNLSHWNGLFP